MKQIIAGYKYLLSEDILRRDLKPSYILRQRKQQNISGFGFAVQIKFGYKGKFNVGTPLYMSPEALNNNFYLFKADLFHQESQCTKSQQKDSMAFRKLKRAHLATEEPADIPQTQSKKTFENMQQVQHNSAKTKKIQESNLQIMIFNIKLQMQGIFKVKIQKIGNIFFLRRVKISPLLDLSMTLKNRVFTSSECS